MARAVANEALRDDEASKSLSLVPCDGRPAACASRCIGLDSFFPFRAAAYAKAIALVGGSNEESRFEGTAFSDVRRWPNRGGIRRDAGADYRRVLDRHFDDRHQRQLDVQQRG